MDCLFAKTGDGGYVEVGRAFTWLYPNMPSRRRLFAYHVAYSKLTGKDNLTECARLSGYSEKDARVQAQVQYARKDVQLEVANLKAQLAQRLAKINVDEAIYHTVKNKVNRALLCVLDLYDASGLPKPPSELTEAQRAAIVAVEYPRGMLNYRVDKVQAENELIDLWQRMKETESADAGGYDVEATMRSVSAPSITIRKHKPFEYQHAINPSYED